MKKRTSQDLRHDSESLEKLVHMHEESRGIKNGVPWYTCHIHQHKHPEKAHLRIEERDGKAVAICDSFGVIGDIYNVYEAYTGERDFLKQKQAIEETQGFISYKTPRRKPRPSNTRNAGIESNAVRDCAGCFLPLEQEKVIWKAVERAEQNKAELSAYARMLNLSDSNLLSRTDKENAALGMLGIWEDGRLVYVYTARDNSGQWRAIKAKLRNHASAAHRFESWPATGKLPPPWGWESIKDANSIIMVEGESDALAVYISLENALYYELSENPDTYEAATAFAPAVVAVPGASTFKKELAKELQGKAVIIAFDRDKAGEAGAHRTAELLKNAGVRYVCRWVPPPPFKDAREYYDAADPCRLITSILQHRNRL